MTDQSVPEVVESAGWDGFARVVSEALAEGREVVIDGDEPGKLKATVGALPRPVAADTKSEVVPDEESTRWQP